MFFKSNKISNRIILLVLSLELVSISVWGYATYSNSRTELLNSLNSRLYEVALRMETELNRFIEPTSIHINAIGNTIQALNLSQKEIIPVINELFNTRPEIEELSILNINGKELYRHSRLQAYTDQDARDLAADELVVKALASDHSSSPISFSKYYEPLKRMLFKIDNKRGKSFLVDVTLNLKWIWGLAQQQLIGETGYVYIVGEDSKLISYPDHSLVLSGKQVDRMLPAAMFKQQDNRQMQIYPSLIGQQVAGMSRYDERMHWWIIVELPTSEGLVPLTRMLRWFIFVFICAAAFAIVTVLIFARITMRPLEDIMKAIGRISQGEPNVQVSINTGSELSNLADGINDMARRLDERIQMLTESQKALLASQSRYKQLNRNLKKNINVATHELRDTNQKLQESAKKAEAANQSKSMFLANTSHELRTPLNAILGYSEIICEDAEERKDKQLVEDSNKIIYSARYLLELINNLLDLSKIEKGKLQLLPEKFEMRKFLESIVDVVIPLAAANNNRFTLQSSVETESVIQDITRMRQIIINLVGNACKFTHDGEITLTAYVLNVKNIEHLHLCVSDTGIGMTPEQIEKLFEVFQQADAKTTRRFGGSGLGLALSKQLAILMKGDIYASSVFGEGSDFTLVLPRDYNDQRLTEKDNQTTSPAFKKKTA